MSLSRPRRIIKPMSSSEDDEEMPTRWIHRLPTPDEPDTSRRIFLGAKLKGTPVGSLEGFPLPRSTVQPHSMPEMRMRMSRPRRIIKPMSSTGLFRSVRFSSFHRGHGHVRVYASRRIVLLGQTGVGKSAAGNTILGQREFRSLRSTNSVTCECSEKHATVSGRSVSVVDTPGLYHTQMKPEELITEIMRSVYLSSPGPHAFIIVFPVNMRFTEHDQQIPEQIKTLFGEEVLKYSIILFTHGDQLDGETVEKLIEENCRLRDVVGQCGGRFQVFNNRDENNRDQVNDLLKKIDTMIQQNGGGYYSHQMYEDAQRLRREEEEKRKQQIEKQRREEIERVIKETEEKIRAEFEGLPRFLQERLKAMREEDRVEELKRERRQNRGALWLKFHQDIFRQLQRQQEIESVIKETEEKIRAEFKGPPR